MTLRPASLLRRRQSGGVTVEFAVILPVIVLVLMFIVASMRIQLVSLLLERSLYSIAYQTRVARGRDFPGIVERTLAANHFFLFDPGEVVVEAKSAPSVGQLFANNVVPGTGRPGSVVMLTLRARLDLFGDLFSQMKRPVILTLMSMTEPDY